MTAAPGYIYLASPYSSDDPALRDARYQAVAHLMARMVERGERVYCPIVQSVPLCRHAGMSDDWRTWRDHDYLWIASASLVRVACMDGWEESTGVTAEISYAHSAGVPIQYELIDTDALFRAAGVLTQEPQT